MAIGRPVSLTNNVSSKTISVTATAGQTLFTVAGGYRINQLLVYRNGVKLAQSTDFIANNGTSVTLVTPANTGDNLDFQVFDDFRVADAIVSTASSQTVNGDLAVTGTLYFPTGSGLDLSNVNSSGIITATKFVGDLTGSDVTVSGVSTFSNTVRVGSAITLGASSGIITATGANITGIVTATKFVGSGESLTGVASTDNIITGTAATFTNDVNISGVTTVGVLTAYTTVKVGTAITADATSGIITATGVNATGVVTATTFKGGLSGNVTGNVSGDLTGSVIGNVTGNATGLSGSPSITVTNITAADITASGTLTYEDVTNVDSVGLVTARSGIEFGASGVGGTITAVGQAEFAGIVTATGVNATGVVTATTFKGNVTGNVTGDLTGDVTGDLTGNVTGNATGLSGTPDITVRNVTGVAATFTDVVKVGIAITADATTGIITATGVNATGIVTATGVNVGSGVTISGTSGITLNEATNASHIINPLLVNYAEKVNTIGNTGANQTIDVADGTFVTATLNDDCTFTFTSPPSGKLYGFALQLTNDGQAGRSISWPGTVRWSGGSTPPSRTTTANKTDVWSFFTSDGGSNWYGAISLFNFG